MLGEEGGTGEANNTVDLIFQSVHKNVKRMDPDNDNKEIWVKIMDDLSLWCKTLKVASPKLGDVIYNMMEVMRNGMNASKNMCKERALVWQEETLEIAESVRKALDAKASESMVDGHNKQNTLLDTVNKSSSERIISMKDNAKQSIWDSILHKEKDKISDE